MNGRILMTAVMLAFATSAEATPTVSGDGACGVRAVENESFLTCDGDRAPEAVAMHGGGDGGFPAAMAITARQAVQMKADLGSRVLLADIRGLAPGLRFLEIMDAALAGAGLRHGDPVILLGDSAREGSLAAELLREHGYQQIFAIADRRDERLAADRSASAR